MGGVFWESTALANTLRHAGVVAPHTRKPLSEAMCFGLPGGIAAGYALSPALPGRGGPAVTLIGRLAAQDAGPVRVRDALRRIGAKVRIRETAGRVKAQADLLHELAAERPAFVWCVPPPGFAHGWAGTLGHYVIVVHAIDARRRVAVAADRSRRPIEFPLAVLAALRGGARVHRHRILTFEPPRRLGAGLLRAAALEAIRQSARDMLRPRQKAYNLPGLLEGARHIADPGHRRGWPRAFPGGRVYAALRDVFDSIETSGTGGGLHRPMFARFLEESAALSGKRALKSCVKTYRGLGERWSELADEVLPAKVPALRTTRILLRARERTIARGGPRVQENVLEIRDELGTLEKSMRARFPFDRTETMALLTRVSEGLIELHGAEERAARALWSAVR